MKAKLAPKCSWSCTLNALKSFSNFCPCLGNKVFNYDHYFFLAGVGRKKHSNSPPVVRTNLKGQEKQISRNSTDRENVEDF